MSHGKVSKNIDVVDGKVPSSDDAVTNFTDHQIMPRSGPAKTPGNDTNSTEQFTYNKGIPGKTSKAANVFQ